MIPLRTLAILFLRLGVTSFGGPAAHIALLHYEVVRRRRWISDADFADLIALTNLIPGPNSTEMAIHVGRRMSGWAGLALAGLCFILPGALIVVALAAAYVRYGTLPEARAILNGITPVVLAIIAHATLAMGRATLLTPSKLVLALGCAALALAGVNELLVLALAGAASMMTGRWTMRSVAIVSILVVQTEQAMGAATVPLPQLFFFFLKVGAVLFGSGYVLVAFLRADLVERWQWLTDQQLLDAVAIGQVTPGPLFTTATFIGYVLHGVHGAALATIGIFLPAFIFVALTGPLVRHLRASPAAGRILDGIVAGSVGLIGAVAAQLAMASAGDPIAIVIAVASFVTLWLLQPNATWLIAAGALVGLLTY